MNITMLVLNAFTHDARVHKEAKTLAASGHNVLVLALHRPGLAEDEQRDGYRVARVVLQSRRWRGGRLAPLAKYLEFMSKVARITRLRPADVYHSHDANTLLATYPVVRRDGAIWVYDSHELERGRNFGGSHLAGIYRWLWPLPERLFVHRVDVVISANPSYAAQLVSAYGIQPPVVITNCPEYTPPLTSHLLQDKLRIRDDQRIVLYQGLVSRGRGIGVSIQGLQYLPSEIVLAVLGDGPARGELETLALDLGLSKRVFFLGRVPLTELPLHTASAAVGLSLIQNTCQSYYYTLPNKLLEYVMAGLPVVASDFPEMRRVIQEYQVGEVVHDPSSPRSVAAALSKVLEDPNRYQQMRFNAQRAAQILNWERESTKLVDLYDRLGD